MRRGGRGRSRRKEGEREEIKTLEGTYITDIHKCYDTAFELFMGPSVFGRLATLAAREKLDDNFLSGPTDYLLVFLSQSLLSPGITGPELHHPRTVPHGLFVPCQQNRAHSGKVLTLEHKGEMGLMKWLSTKTITVHTCSEIMQDSCKKIWIKIFLRSCMPFPVGH